ncbi:MAG: rhodanese-like domain-containing protein [Cyclobacteriaceae bacterium]
MEDITAEELKRRREANEDLNIIDVREEYEYDEDNIGVKNISLNTLPNRLDEIEQHKDEELIVHCRSGARSSNAKNYLTSQGFTKVRNLEKGIEGYRASGGK